MKTSFRKPLTVSLRAAALVAVVAAWAQPTDASGHGKRCHPMHGHFSSMPVAPPACTSPVGFCTAGDLWGGLQGGYSFTMNTAIPSNDPTVPGVTFYTGTSLIAMKDGGSLVGTDTGAVDLSPVGTGKMVSLITVTDGADGYEGAHGYLQLRGTMNFLTGAVTGEYVGELCRP
jgi:hypothetical protein